MIRPLLFAMTLAVLSGCGPKPATPTDTAPAAPAPATDAISEIAHVYAFSAAVTGGEGAPVGPDDPNCLIKLDADDMDPREQVVVRRVWMEPACYPAFPALRAVTQWELIPAAGVRLLGGDPLATIGEFSPVQDGTGVYIRGGAGSDGKVYEMRTPNA